MIGPDRVGGSANFVSGECAPKILNEGTLRAASATWPRMRGTRMDRASLIEYGAPIDPQTMVSPPDVTELELEPGHPGLGDKDYIQRRQELFALCRRHRLENLGPPLIGYTREETRI